MMPNQDLPAEKAIAKGRPDDQKTAKPAASSDGNQSGVSHPAKTSWTILLDIAADGLLANFAVESLKQLKSSTGAPYCDTELATVMVAAQFAVDAPAGQKIPRYIFGPQSTGSLADCIKGYLYASRTMTEQQALIDFLQWAFQQPELEAEHYALILWGHGPELLMEPPPGPGHSSARLFLSPIDLRIAMQVVLSTPMPNGKHELDLIAFDACSMSMFEVAYELRNYSQYMVGSQEEVPDLSFPYNTIVPLFRSEGSDPETMLRKGVYAYIQAYEDYIDDAVTNMKSATLSALRLSKCNDLKDALCKFSCALCAAKGMTSLPSLLIRARENARDFVSGLYVDLFDFASALISALDAGARADLRDDCSDSSLESGPDCWKRPICAACVDICSALMEDTACNGELLVLANRSADETCHGVSLYMPYLSNDQLAGITRPMIKGGDATRGGKDFSTVLNDSALQQLLLERRDLIADTEHYYEDLELSLDTGWYRFIVEQWTPILVNTSNVKLDLLYSAEQAALNACRTSVKPVRVAKALCPGQTDCS
jgi:hypothetical protein